MIFMKIAKILGTRPEIIKMAPLLDQMEKRGIDNILIHTGQHYDHEMSQQFFLDLELKKPDFNIGVGSNSHGKQTAIMIQSIEEVLLAENPDFIMVQGDTNAVLAGALAASKLNMAVGHVEAGLRSFDNTMPEEINRKIADICSSTVTNDAVSRSSYWRRMSAFADCSSLRRALNTSCASLRTWSSVLSNVLRSRSAVSNLVISR